MYALFLVAPLTAVGVGSVRWLTEFGHARRHSWKVGVALTVLGFLSMDTILLSGSPERNVGSLSAITLYALGGALAVGGMLLASSEPDADEHEP